MELIAVCLYKLNEPKKKNDEGETKENNIFCLKNDKRETKEKISYVLKNDEGEIKENNIFCLKNKKVNETVHGLLIIFV